MSARPKTGVEIDIVSDIVCPWCWLGKRRFQAALEKVGGLPVNVSWRPYELDPNVPVEGVPYHDYMRKKFAGAGAAERVSAMRDDLLKEGAAAGLDYRFDDIKIRPNSLNAHRLVRWASGQGKGDAAKEALFAAFFKDGEDIGDAAVLTRIAGEIGLDAALVAELLETDRDVDEVRKEIQFFRDLGVSGVPTFIFNGRFAISGAQPPDALAAAILKAAEEGPYDGA